jgi:hypothetical protein
VNGQTYTGDPVDYEHQYGGGFTNDDGSVKRVEDMKLQDKRAYAAWLEDPAVQTAVYGDWSEGRVGTIPKPSG